MPDSLADGYAASVHMVTDRDGETLCIWIHGWVCDGVAMAESWDEPITADELAEAERRMVWRAE